MPTETPNRSVNILQNGKKQYLIAPRSRASLTTAGLEPFSAAALDSTIKTLGIDVVRTIAPASLSTRSAEGDAAHVYVTRIETERARLLQVSAPPQMIIEEDQFLGYGYLSPNMVLRGAPGISATFDPGAGPRSIVIRVLGEGERPLPNIDVTLVGEGWPASGRTDEKGEVVLSLYLLPGRAARSLFASAKNAYWNRFINQPDLSDASVNVVRLRSLRETISGFPSSFRYGWGARAMGLDTIPDQIDGAGVRVAVIDSGVDTSHPLLAHVTRGLDLMNQGNPRAWTNDVLGHGTHCAGIIAARSASMMRGFAPGAEIHVLRIFPGGQFSNLLDALNYCILNQIDVANLSLGTAQGSPTVEQKLLEAVENGVACVVAAGNSGGVVQYPAASPNVLTVSAIGALGEVRPDSWDATQVVQRLVTTDGIFSPSFTCFGPEVGVCAPGVSIISSVPGGEFEPQSGTSMAAPHVTGLAALLLAHHPALRGTRGVGRVRALFDLIRQVSAPLPFGRDRTGAGIPKLTGLATTLQPSVTPTRTVVSVPAAPVAGAGGPPAAPAGGPVAPVINLGPTSVVVPALQPFWFLRR